MTKEIDIKQVTPYLLGALPAKEAERLDDLSVTDDDFAMALSAAENDLVDAYIHGELPAPQLKQFESHYLASPRRREKVRFAQAFQSWAEKNPVAISSAEAEVGPKSKKAGWFSALSMTAPRPALQWGFALVAMLLLVVGVWLAVDNSRLRRQISQAQPPVNNQVSQPEEDLKKRVDEQRAANSRTEEELAQLRTERDQLEQELQRRGASPRPPTSAIASFILTPQLRGAGDVKTVKLPTQTKMLSMHLQLEPNQYSAYTVTLLDDSTHRAVWRSAKVKATGSPDSKFVSISFPATLLNPQSYRLQVSGVSGSGAAEILSDYRFRVVK
jgi:hypothetical protein